jgi:hypothetical protein
MPVTNAEDTEKRGLWFVGYSSLIWAIRSSRGAGPQRKDYHHRDHRGHGGKVAGPIYSVPSLISPPLRG